MRRVLVALLGLLAIGLLLAAWYGYDRGFTRKWRTVVADEFRKRDIELTLRKLTLDPFRGIIAQEVRVYDPRDRKRTLAVVDEMRLVINWANLIHGKTFLDALDLHDATLALPINPEVPTGPRFEIRRMSGRLFLPPQQVYLSSFEADIYGIRVTASGRLVNPQAARRNPSTPETAKATADLIARITDELHQLRYEGETPVLDLHFSGDLAKPETVFAEAKLWAQQVRRLDWRLANVYLDLIYREQRVAIRQLMASDAHGALRLSGNYDLPAKAAELQFRSTLDPQPLLKPLIHIPELDTFTFKDPPDLDVSVRAAFGDSPAIQVLGHVGAKRFVYRTVAFTGFDADAVWDGERWAARNVRLKQAKGEVTGDVMQLPGDFRVRLKSTINPKALAPLLSGPAAEWFRQVDFADAPQLSLEARGPDSQPAHLSGNAALKLGRTAYRDVWAQSAAATLRYGDRKLTVDPLRIVRAEGTADGGLMFDFARDEVEVRKIRTSLHPQEIVWWVDTHLVNDLAPYRFGRRPPNLLMDGLVDTKGGSSTQFRVEVEAPGGLDYTFLRHDLHASQISARLDFTKERMKISGLDGTVFGGHLRGSADISLDPNDQNHSADVKVENMDFAALTKLYFNYDDSKGRLNGRYGFSIHAADARTMRGRGELSVTDGKVFAIPFLGPLSFILNNIVPGMGDNVARRGSASFTLGDGIIDTRDFLVEASGFSMMGGGKLMFLDDRMNFDVRINARGLPGVLLFPVSKLFEYTSTDSLSKPTWRPKIVPRL